MLFWLMPAHSHGIRSQTELGVLVGIEARPCPPQFSPIQRQKKTGIATKACQSLYLTEVPYIISARTPPLASPAKKRKKTRKRCFVDVG
jgi:hypothetical protein